MRGKKGDIELQFNWIFVFIVGTLILAAAAGFVVKQKNNSDILISGQIIRFTRTVITLTSATPGTARPEALQKPIGVSCEPDTCGPQGCTSDIYVYPRSLQAKVDTPITVVFSPELIRGDNMGTWSMEWSMPFHINNFLYMTSDQARYVFVKMGDPTYDSMVEELYEDMPEAMGDKDLIDYAELYNLKDRNNYMVRIVYISPNPGLGGIPGALSKMDDRYVTALHITPTDGWSIGTVRFFIKSKDTGDFEEKGNDLSYLGKATVFGAIFSDKPETYECNMKKALLRYQRVTDLYRMKAETLQASMDMSSPKDSSCYWIYQDILDNLGGLALAIQYSDYPPMKYYSNEITTLSRSLLQTGCSPLYS